MIDQAPAYPVFQSYDDGANTHTRAWFVMEDDARAWADGLNARLVAGEAL